jgi:hypothetical protein
MVRSALTDRSVAQVWLSRSKNTAEFVGHWRCPVHEWWKLSRIMALMPIELEFITELTRETEMAARIEADVLERRFSITDRPLWDHDRRVRFLAENRVPAYAERTRDLEREMDVYSWPILQISLAEYERLFDHEDFTPL